MRSLRAFLIAVVAAVSVVVVPVAVAGVRLTLPASSLPGWHPTGTSVGLARRDLAASLPHGPAGAVDGAQTQTSAARGPGGRLRSDAFVFGSANRARWVLASWRGLHHARSVRVGGAVYLSAGGKATVVAWRHGARIGLIALTATRGSHDPSARALAYAVLADGWLHSPLPTTVWDKVLDQIRPNGTVSKQTALEAFAVVYGPLPGVHPPAGRRTKIQSGTLAAQWIRSYLPQLTPAQQRVVRRRLGIPSNTPLAHAADYGDPTFHVDYALQLLAYNYVKIYQARLGHTLGLPLVMGKSSESSQGYADTAAVGDPLACRIRVLPAGQAVMSQQSVEFVPPLDLILAHEVFHCFQGDITGWKGLPAWITEGMADWAALSVDPVAYFHGGGNLNTYINNPHTPLFQRSYDAVGFWGHAEDLVPNQWAGIPAILNAGSSEGSFHLAGADADEFLNSWGSSVFRLCCGSAWTMQSPITPPSQAQQTGGLEEADLLAMPIVQVEAPALSTSQYQILGGPSEPVVHVDITGHARLSTHYDYTQLQDAWFCLGASPCECPKGTEGEVPPTQPLGNVSAFPLGLSGDPGTGTNGVLSSFPLSYFCHPKQGPTGTSNGDPYMSTFDHAGYGFQLAGEFTLVRSTVDDLEIQSRQVPYRLVLGRQWGNSLAMNTAFAMRDGGAIVEVDKGAPLVLYINRRRFRARPGQVIALSGGGSVNYSSKQVTLTWPDGTHATVLSIGSEGVNINVTPSASRAGKLRGLLGNDDGNRPDDFIGRDGRRYNAKKIESVGLFAFSRAAVRILLGGFGRSWRISQAQSLFVYPPGKSTRSYLVPGFPHALMSLLALTRARRLAAARACAGVSDSLRVGCEIDFGATGDRRLVIATRALQRAAGLPPATVNLSGRWSGQYSGRFNGTFTLDWKQSGSKLNGTIKLSNPRSTLSIRGIVSHKTIEFGDVGGVLYSGSVDGDSMSGTYRLPRVGGGGSWSATKIS